MTALITLTVVGSDTGPFNIYSDLDGYTTPFETGVAKSALVAGYLTNLVPDGTVSVRVQSTGVCTTYVDLTLQTTTTTSTTSTTTSTSTTTTTTTTLPVEGQRWFITYTTISPTLQVRYAEVGTGTIITTDVLSLITIDNGDGSYTGVICTIPIGAYSSPVFVQDGVEIATPVGVDVTMSGTCT